MMRHVFAPLLPLALMLASAPLPAQTEPAAPISAAPSKAARQEIVAALGTALRDRYVFPDVGARAAAAIEAALGRGDYDGLADRMAFAARLSADIGAIAHDRHLTISAQGMMPPPPPSSAMPRPLAEGGITRADRLAGGVGYIEVIGFPPPGPFRQALDRAMASLAGSHALIVDVRRNGGGAAESVPYLLSFLAPPDKPTSDIVSRIEKTSDVMRKSFRTVATPVSFAATPIYVLTSSATFSGGEAFAYDMQALERAMVIGEVTGGGANPTMFVDLVHGFAAAIPFARAENPLTGGNWEGRGVQPDIAVPAVDALAIALKRIGQTPSATIELASIEQTFRPRPMPMPGQPGARAIPLPGSEAALRRIVTGLAEGALDLSLMTPEQAEMTRQQLPRLQAHFVPLGALRSMRFRGPDMMGGDEYELHFAGGDRLMALVMGPDGKVVALSSPLPLPARP